MLYVLIAMFLVVTYVFHTTRNRVIQLLELGKHDEALQLLKLTTARAVHGVSHGVSPGIEMTSKTS